MDELPKYLAGIVVLIVTIYRAIKNQQQKTSSRTESTSTIPNTDASELDTIFEMERERQAYSQKSEKIVLNSSPAEVEKKKVNVDSDSFFDEEQQADLDREDLLGDFDARKAIIYSEILKPPYL